MNPRNPILSELFFFEARKKAETQSQKYLVDFYEAYVVKLVSAQIGDEEGYSTANEKILGLLKEDREGELPGVIYHAIGKEVYKVGLNMIGRNYKKSQNQMMEKAESFFSIAASKQDPNSLYYLGEMYESGNAKGGVNIKKAIECYKSSAALNNPRSFFKLSIL